MHIRPAFVAGGLMCVVGAFVVYGAVTGNLAAMLAAVFDPGVLKPTSGSQQNVNNFGPRPSGAASAVQPGTGFKAPPGLAPQFGGHS